MSTLTPDSGVFEASKEALISPRTLASLTHQIQDDSIMSATSPMGATAPILSPIPSKRLTAYSPRMETYITDSSIDKRFDHRNRTVGKIQTGNNILNRTLGSPEV